MFRNDRFPLYEIKPLYKDMSSHNAKQDKFKFKLKQVKFDVIFLIDRKPFELLFGVIDYNFSFSLKLYPGFLLETLSDDIFFKLCDILNLKPGKEIFTSFKFLQYFSQNIPTTYSGIKVQPEELAKYKVNDIDEATKIYFKGWRTHTTDGKNAKKENLEKTKNLLGSEAYEFCKKNNISSCWSDKKSNKVEYFPPNKFIE